MDQGILAQSLEAVFLGPAWNYKVYWGGDARDVKIVHFHGPKPGRGDLLACLASQKVACATCPGST